MKLIHTTPLVHDGRNFEIRVYGDGASFRVAPFENERCVAIANYQVDDITDSDLFRATGLHPYASLIGVVASDIARGWVKPKAS